MTMLVKYQIVNSIFSKTSKMYHQKKIQLDKLLCLIMIVMHQVIYRQTTVVEHVVQWQS